MSHLVRHPDNPGRDGWFAVCGAPVCAELLVPSHPRCPSCRAWEDASRRLHLLRGRTEVAGVWCTWPAIHCTTVPADVTCEECLTAWGQHEVRPSPALEVDEALRNSNLEVGVDEALRNANLEARGYSKDAALTACVRCGVDVLQSATGRWRDYCSSRCRQAAYRARR